MSLSLPPELLDLIVDHLRDERATLNACCTVSKSWVPRARRHLFFRVDFIPESSIASWMKAFPDPSSSPARYARVISLNGLSSLALASTFVRSFRYIVELQVTSVWWSRGQHPSLVPLHGLSPTLKSLYVYGSFIPLLELLNLIYSFPLLEDLRLYLVSAKSATETEGWDAPSTPAKLTGSLRLRGEIRSVTRRLLSLPNGLHFAKIEMMCLVEDVGLVIDLVSRCSGTLESLYIGSFFLGTPTMPPPIDLSKVLRLKDVQFDWTTLNVQWITLTLETAKSKNLRQIRLHSSVEFVKSIGEEIRQEWRDLDRLLVQLWTSHSIRPKFTFSGRVESDNLKKVVPSLLPELTSKGAADVIVY